MHSESGKFCVNIEKNGKVCYSNCEMNVGNRIKGGQKMKKKISVNVKKSPMKVLSFVLSSTMLVTSLGGVGFALANNSSAQSDGAKNSTQNLSPVIDPSSNEEMFVVNSTFYDYYSDSQVEGASGATPG